MRLLSSIAIGLLVATASGCTTRPNPDFCCVTADACAAAGLVDELRPCEVGQACRSYGCVAAECTTSADCTSAEAPACVHGLCTAGCTIDDDCAGVSDRPHCDTIDATCVGCTSSDQCPAGQAICDPDTRSCRGCTADDQCASGVCIEATGICAADGEIIYVLETGTDTGTCPKAAPCKTISFAMGLMGPARSVIRILGGMYHLGNSPVYLTGSVIVDGSGTLLTSGASPAIVSAGAGTVEGVRISSLSNDPAMPLIQVATGSDLTLTRTVLEDGQIEVLAGGALDLSGVGLRNSNLECKAGGVLAMRKSQLEQGHIVSACKLVLAGSRLEPAPGLYPLRFQGPMQLIENNVFISNDAEMLLLLIGPSEGAFRFNTIVNTSSLTGSAAAITCDETVDVTSNIIAYNSTRPLLGVARYSLFDTAGAQEVSRGVGNRSADIVTIFKDRQAGDFHPAEDSPAFGFGEPGLVTTDLDGNPRPMPVGSRPDVGAYEAP